MATAKQAQPEFFAVAPAKLAVMSFFTLGIYDLYWFYKNWKAVQTEKDGKFWLFIRVLFCPISAFSLFKKMGIPKASPLAAAYLASCMASRLPDPWSLVSLLGFLPLVLVQITANKSSASKPLTRYSKKEIVFAVLGGILTLLVIVNALLPS